MTEPTLASLQLEIDWLKERQGLAETKAAMRGGIDEALLHVAVTEVIDLLVSAKVLDPQAVAARFQDVSSELLGTIAPEPGVRVFAAIAASVEKYHALQPRVTSG